MNLALSEPRPERARFMLTGGKDMRNGMTEEVDIIPFNDIF
jgi:hypothetical protein